MPTTYQQGRLFDHVHLTVADLAVSRRFYQAVLAALGRDDAFGATESCCFCDELYIAAFVPGGPALSRVHLAFQASSQAQVQSFHRAAVAAGGACNGPSGYRDYHPSYYAAFVLDPDGNNIEAIFDGADRSAPAIIRTRRPGQGR